MADQRIKDGSGRTIAFTRSLPGGRTQLLDGSGRTLGFEDKNGRTTDNSCKLVATGKGSLSTLIPRC